MRPVDECLYNQLLKERTTKNEFTSFKQEVLNDAWSVCG